MQIPRFITENAVSCLNVRYPEHLFILAWLGDPTAQMVLLHEVTALVDVVVLSCFVASLHSNDYKHCLCDSPFAVRRSPFVIRES